MTTKSGRGIAILVAAGLILALAAPVAAHPGRLDAEGCHTVRARYVYSSGIVAEPGEAYCHRKLDQGFRLDGREILQDDRPAARPPRRPDCADPNTEACAERLK